MMNTNLKIKKFPCSSRIKFKLGLGTKVFLFIEDEKEDFEREY